MDLLRIIREMEISCRIITSFFVGVSLEKTRWKPAPDKWSMLEVLCHLYDEEQYDFRTRIRLTLENPANEWPPIDPEKWAVEKNYNEKEPISVSRAFKREREESILWLSGLSGVNWDNVHEHPLPGGLKAGDLLISWAAHDYLHIRQLANINIEQITANADPYSIRYAAP